MICAHFAQNNVKKLSQTQIEENNDTFECEISSILILGKVYSKIGMKAKWERPDSDDVFRCVCSVEQGQTRQKNRTGKSNRKKTMTSLSLGDAWFYWRNIIFKFKTRKNFHSLRLLWLKGVKFSSTCINRTSSPFATLMWRLDISMWWHYVLGHIKLENYHTIYDFHKSYISL